MPLKRWSLWEENTITDFIATSRSQANIEQFRDVTSPSRHAHTHTHLSPPAASFFLTPLHDYTDTHSLTRARSHTQAHTSTLAHEIQKTLTIIHVFRARSAICELCRAAPWAFAWLKVKCAWKVLQLFASLRKLMTGNHTNSACMSAARWRTAAVNPRALSVSAATSAW